METVSMPTKVWTSGSTPAARKVASRAGEADARMNLINYRPNDLATTPFMISVDPP